MLQERQQQQQQRQQREIANEITLDGTRKHSFLLFPMCYLIARVSASRRSRSADSSLSLITIHQILTDDN